MEEKYTVRTAMKWIVDRQGREIYQNDMLLNNMLSDLAAGIAEQGYNYDDMKETLERVNENVSSQETEPFRICESFSTIP